MSGSSQNQDLPFSFDLSSPSSPPLPSVQNQASSQPVFTDVLSPIGDLVPSDQLNEFVSSLFTKDSLEDDLVEKEDQKKLPLAVNPTPGTTLATTTTYAAAPFALGDFNPDYKDAPAFARKWNKNARGLIASYFRRRGLPDRPSKMSLSNPTLRRGLAVFGTDTASSTEHYLMCVDTKADLEDEKLLIGLQRRNEPVQYSTFLADDVFACASTKGKVEIFQINRKTREMKSSAVLTVHTDDIRELSGCPGVRSHSIATTGYDRKLCVTDLDRQLIVQSVSLSGVGGSVKWTAFQDSCIGCTTDDGNLVLFDIKSGTLAQKYTVGLKKDVYTHLRYSPLHVMLGMGDGEIQHLDLRKLDKPLRLVEDPFCEGIGMIEFNQRQDAIVTSGYTDFTVWKQDSKSNDMNIWSHSEPQGFIQSEVTFCATWLDDDTVFATNSTGSFGFWTQGFEYY